ncbi:unnamed protein product [Cercopithifilaria johnstoni]|uniref:EF-hand domain-containing protein n=1 Tax=Cercopithifilaria johnstoni TaxID=2874296 RepID=A0A8J2MSY7_9BILA|nr:unnamed protein product [Cercopithifilaria johnstoni]
MLLLPATLHLHQILFTATFQFIIFITQILPSIQNVNNISELNSSSSPTPPPPPVAVKFGEKDEVHDTAHIRQHLKQKVDIDKISLNKNLEIFHYFRMHDLNEDGRIDGLELIKAITHLHDEINENTKRTISDADLEDMVSETLKKLDIDDDGYITYAEYRQVDRN